jgi:3',5'-cyclic AMP phosphodiesterase CpdA
MAHATALVIAHVSDLHLGAHDAVAVDTLPADVAAARPTLTVVTGDVTMRARAGEFRRVPRWGPTWTRSCRRRA